MPVGHAPPRLITPPASQCRRGSWTATTYSLVSISFGTVTAGQRLRSRPRNRPLTAEAAAPFSLSHLPAAQRALISLASSNQHHNMDVNDQPDLILPLWTSLQHHQLQMRHVIEQVRHEQQEWHQQQVRHERQHLMRLAHDYWHGSNSSNSNSSSSSCSSSSSSNDGRMSRQNYGSPLFSFNNTVPLDDVDNDSGRAFGELRPAFACQPPSPFILLDSHPLGLPLQSLSPTDQSVAWPPSPRGPQSSHTLSDPDCYLDLSFASISPAPPVTPLPGLSVSSVWSGSSASSDASSSSDRPNSSDSNRSAESLSSAARPQFELAQPRAERPTGAARGLDLNDVSCQRAMSCSPTRSKSSSPGKCVHFLPTAAQSSQQQPLQVWAVAADCHGQPRQQPPDAVSRPPSSGAAAAASASIDRDASERDSMPWRLQPVLDVVRQTLASTATWPIGDSLGPQAGCRLVESLLPRYGDVLLTPSSPCSPCRPEASEHCQVAASSLTAAIVEACNEKLRPAMATRRDMALLDVNDAGLWYGNVNTASHCQAAAAAHAPAG